MKRSTGIIWKIKRFGDLQVFMFFVTEGVKHTSKALAKICDVPEADMPVWFKNGVKAAMMAPTAVNQQKFFITLDGEEPVITAGRGRMAKIDLGIVKYNFEAASGHACR